MIGDFSPLFPQTPLCEFLSAVYDDDYDDCGGDGLLQSADDQPLVTVHHRRVRLPDLRWRL